MWNFQVEKLKKLPQRKQEVWQAGSIRMSDLEVTEKDPHEPVTVLWISATSKHVGPPTLVGPGEDKCAKALDGLIQFAENKEFGKMRPGRVEVRDRDLADFLSARLAPAGIEVVHRETLAELDEFLDFFREEMRDLISQPFALSVPGVTLERFRAFTEAAEAFYKAAPWDMLSDDDLVRVESPKVPEKGLRFFTVLGGGGQAFGLGFLESERQFRKIYEAEHPSDFFAKDTVWSLTFDSIEDLPSVEAKLWETYHLPVADEEAYPVLAQFSPGNEVRPPNAEVMSFVEGLLRVLADTKEAEIDNGRWTRTATTFDGPVEYTLSLPGLLESVGKTGKSRSHQPGQTPLAEAQNLIYEAQQAHGRRAIQLAKKALEICPDCADAYVFLAEGTADLEKRHALLKQGVAAGERALGKDAFTRDAGHFWGILETRPYMRARFDLGQCLEDMDRLEEAVDHYRDLLRLNPNDNQGVRYILIARLIELDQDEEARNLLRRYEKDGMAAWAYARALLTFRREGDSPAAAEQLQAALKVNKYVPRYLLEREPFPDFLPDDYGLGDVNEGIICADELFEAWDMTPGARKWLSAQVKAKKKSRRKS